MILQVDISAPTFLAHPPAAATAATAASISSNTPDLGERNQFIRGVWHRRKLKTGCIYMYTLENEHVQPKEWNFWEDDFPFQLGDV